MSDNLRKYGIAKMGSAGTGEDERVAVALEVELFNVVIKTLLSTFCFRIFYARRKTFVIPKSTKHN